MYKLSKADCMFWFLKMEELMYYYLMLSQGVVYIYKVEIKVTFRDSLYAGRVPITYND